MSRNAKLFIFLFALALGACGRFEPPKGAIGVPQGKGADAEAPPEIPSKGEETPYFVKQPERESGVPSYNVPEPLRAKIDEQLPQFLPPQPKSFSVSDPVLKIKVKDATMTFSAKLKVLDLPPEAIELRCKFDPAKAWSCANMFPVSEEVARTRRLQASANCMDTYQCDEIAIELFVRVNGKIESQFFQSVPFKIRRASSGDEIISDEPQKTKQEPKRLEKPTTSTELTDSELGEIIDDANQALEVDAPIPVPQPAAGDYSIPEIETFRPRPEVDPSVPNQAIGAHNRGHLENSAALPPAGEGYQLRQGGPDHSHGTNSMIQSIQWAASQMAKFKPAGSPIIVADISNPTGGRLKNRSGRSHASHQTGLDADIAFPTNQGAANDLWSACEAKKSGRCSKGSAISSRFDDDRFWIFATNMVCQKNEPVIAMFLDTEIKRHICNWARERYAADLSNPNSCAFKTLRAMKYEPGHNNHVHVRLKCPGNPDCRNATVSLGKGTGC